MPAYGLSNNNNMAMDGGCGRQLLIFGGLAAQVDRLGLRVGDHPALSLHTLQSHGNALEKNVVSRVSSVIVEIRLPISCVSSMAISCHVPAISMANG